MDASESHGKKLNAKEVLTLMSGKFFLYPIADGAVKLSGGGQVLRTSTIIRDRPNRREEQGNLQGESDASSSTPLRDSYRGMMLKLGMISGPFQASLFTVIMWNPESNCTCREKNHFLFQ